MFKFKQAGYLHLASGAALAAAAVLAAPMAAQTSTQGAISGTVFDASGAIVPSATINIVNDGTAAQVNLTADSSGFYKAPILEPGTYTVTIKAASFGDFKSKVQVQVGQLTEVSPHMATGTETTTVDVTAQVPILNYDSPDFTTVLNQKSIEDIPVNNRRWSALALTTPGVVADSSGFGLVSIRGVATTQNNVEIDGADDNNAYYAEERGRTREAYSTSENAVREFAVNSGVYSAEYGRAAGGVINSVTKSGTNQFHGTLYFYDRESNWNAYQEHSLETVANYAAGSTIPSSFTSIHYKPEDVRKIYGFTVGGPIIKDKLFFMYTYDQQSRIFPAVGVPNSPGTFFTLPDATQPTGSVCSATGYLSGSTNVTDQTACTLAARLNAAGIAPPAGTASGSYGEGYAAYSQQLANLIGNLGYTPRTGYQEINTPKLDWQVNAKNHVSALFHRLRWDSPGGVQTASILGYAVDTDGNDFVKLDYGVIKLSSLVSNTISNEVLFQYGRELLDETQQPFSPYTKSNLKAGSGNIPEVDLFANISGFYEGSPYYSYRPAQPSERKFQIGDTLYFVKGNHSVKVGVDVVHNDDYNNALNQSSPPAGGNGTAANGMYYYSNLGNYLSDLLTQNANVAPGQTGFCNSLVSQAATATVSGLGTNACYAANGYGQAFGAPTIDIATLDFGAFIQDNWKVNPRLTLELGIRFDQERVPAPPSALANPLVPQTAQAAPNGLNFGPRVGFSYDLYGSGKTLLRGGYGLYYGRLVNGTILNVEQDTGNTTAGQYLLYYSATSAGAPRFPNNITASTSTAFPAVYYFGSNLKLPEISEIDLQVQQDLGHGTVFAVSYLGALGRRLDNFLNTNLNPASQQNVAISFVDTTGKSPIPNGTVINVPTFTNSVATTGVPGYLNTSYTSITGVYSNVNSSYDAVVAEVQNRSLRHLQFDLNYTWSHSLDFNQTATTTTNTESWLNPYAAPRQNYGNSIYNVPQRLVFYALYTLPDFVKGANFTKYLANGWSIDNSFQSQSGLPYSLAVSGSTSTISTSSGWEGTGFTSYIPTLGRNTYKYPAHQVDDVRVSKNIPFTEKYNLQLIAQLFNVANKQNIDGIITTGYALKGATATTGTATYSTTFGAVSSSNNSGFLYTPRELEIAAKLRF